MIIKTSRKIKTFTLWQRGDLVFQIIKRPNKVNIKHRIFVSLSLSFSLFLSVFAVCSKGELKSFIISY